MSEKTAEEDEAARAWFERGLVGCYAVSMLSVLHAVLVYSEILEAAVWVASSAYFFTSPAALRKGVEKRRVLVGILSVILALVSFAGLASLVAGSTMFHGLVSLAMLVSSLSLVVIFGYNQKVASYLRGLRSESAESS